MTKMTVKEAYGLVAEMATAVNCINSAWEAFGQCTEQPLEDGYPFDEDFHEIADKTMNWLQRLGAKRNEVLYMGEPYENLKQLQDHLTSKLGRASDADGGVIELTVYGRKV